MVSGDTWDFADEGSKLIENKDILFKHRIKNSVFFISSLNSSRFTLFFSTLNVSSQFFKKGVI